MNEPTTQTSSFEFNHPTIVALLYLVSFVSALPILIGLVLAYIWKGEQGAGWEASHYSFHIRTFWYALVASIVSGILTIVLIGFFGLAAVCLWTIVRTVIALMKAQKHEPIADPKTFLW